MTVEGFRRLALSMPEACERGHMGHPDFRVRDKIFATLGYPAAGWGMVQLTPQQQEALVGREPAVFEPVKGGWGIQGATNVRLWPAQSRSVRLALEMAWENVRATRAASRERRARPGAGRGPARARHRRAGR